jgi:hypothetical protein
VTDREKADEAFRQQVADEAAKQHADPFSDSSGWLTPDWINALFDEIERMPLGVHGDAVQRYQAKIARARAEIATRVQLHIGEKALLLQRKIADDQQALEDRIANQADTTAKAIKGATNRLFIATVALVLATVVLVIVTATHHGSG